MRTDKFFSEKEWNDIVEYAFSADSPQPEFSEDYVKHRENMLSSVRPKHRSIRLSVVLAVVAAACIPVTAFAANRIMMLRAEKSAAYQQKVIIEPMESEGVSEKFEGYRQLRLNYIPEGLVMRYDGKYHDPNSEKAMTPLFYRFNEGKGISEAVNFSSSSVTFELDGKSAVFVDRIDGYDRLWVLFENTPYAAEIYVNDVPMDEVKKLAEGLELVPSDVETAGIWQDINELVDEGSVVSYSNDVDMSKVKVLSAGDSFKCYSNENLDIHIENISLQKNFDGITTNSIGNDDFDVDFGKYLDENGELTAERVTVKRGDGVNTLDEVISREKVDRSVIVMTLTCTNNGNERGEICFYPKMFRMVDGKAIDLTEPDNTTFISYGDKKLGGDNVHFSFYTSGEHEKNSALIEAGESVTVRLAFIADDDSLDTLYINFGEMLYDSLAISAENSGEIVKVTE
ncbi:MAG: hypothetical protein J5999_09470 [Oscillospiraceae bacterium]|nr:hypothetical protein [Oscillospiraceae bacterium]